MVCWMMESRSVNKRRALLGVEEAVCLFVAAQRVNVSFLVEFRVLGG